MRDVGMFFRVTAPERERFRTWAENLNMGQSELFHALVQLDAAGDGGKPFRCVVFDTQTPRDLARELRRWGYHFNQTNHALNSLVYYLNIEEAGVDDIDECLHDVRHRLDRLEGGVEGVRHQLQSMSNDPTLFV